MLILEHEQHSLLSSTVKLHIGGTPDHDRGVQHDDIHQSVGGAPYDIMM